MNDPGRKEKLGLTITGKGTSGNSRKHRQSYVLLLSSSLPFMKINEFALTVTWASPRFGHPHS